MELTGCVDLDLSGIAVRLDGISPAVERGVREHSATFVSTREREPYLRCRFGHLPKEAVPGPFRPKSMASSFAPGRARFTMPEGRAEVDDDGEARIDLAPRLGRREYWTAANLLRACLAWRLPRRGAGLLHAAGLAVEGRGYILVGAEGSGKSSWTRIGEAGGARVVSDDLVLVQAVTNGFELLGAPFRSTQVSDYRPGRWPLAAVLFPIHGKPAHWSPAPAMLARARILANLPFVADAAETNPHLGRLIERLVLEARCLDLTFGLEPSFLDLLRAGPGGA